jgi:hypothetical protein
VRRTRIPEEAERAERGALGEEEIFDEARRITDPGRRRAYLDTVCGDDAALRSRVQGLLAALEDADRFFAEGAAVVAGADLVARRTLGGTPLRGSGWSEPIGSRIGRYKLVEVIGEGGCGMVYLAEQEEPVRRRVALKIIRLGMESRSVIARFEAERQALAMMDHPNIARVFDAGATERGSPYFVMEHVRGVKITAYCEQNRLSVRARLDLFVQICHAIQHAHQKGIVHGDIKPSNIMIALHDGVPMPKVIDFGIARATEATLADEVRSAGAMPLLGTPAYMSPEQVAPGSLDVDTRSDIYSLGVLLHELLVGCTPLDADRLLEAGVAALRRALQENEPEPPSARLAKLPPEALHTLATARSERASRLVALLRGDLDAIVLKALRRDRRQRYETANGLAVDVQRHLSHEPVLARGGGWGYRLQKLVRRNRVVFLAGGAVALALMAGTTVSTWLFLREREARHRAVDAEQQQVRLRREAELREKVAQAALYVSQERFAEADAIVAEVRLAEPTLEGAAVYRAVGEWHAMNYRWSQAADRFGVLLAINQLDGPDVSSLDYLELGPSLIEAGDPDRYERFRREAMQRFGGAPHPFSDRIVKICLLTAASESVLEGLRPFVRTTERLQQSAAEAGETFEAAWRALSLALYEYRRGDYTAAASWARRCLAYADGNAPRAATARAILAMASHRMGHVDGARAEIAAAYDIVETRYRGRLDRGTPVQGFWFDWAFARILLREAARETETDGSR